MRPCVKFSLLLAAIPIAVSACGDDGSASTSGAGGGTTATSSSSTSSTTGGGGSGTGGSVPSGVCPGGPYADDPLPANPVAQEVMGGFHFLEGPVWSAERGILYISDMDFSAQNAPPWNGPPARLWYFTPPDGISEFVENSSTNGLAVEADGDLIACAHGTRSISEIDSSSGEMTVFVDTYMGLRFNSPNDLTLRADGHLYFSDPDWQLSPGTPSELPMAVYHVTPFGEVSVVDTLDKPNGVALSPDGGTLYVGAIDGKIRSYSLDADGAPGGAADFADVPGPDGMAVDCAGNLYVAGSNGVDVLSPAGVKIGTITGTSSTTNVAFGGLDRRTLYITGGGSLYSIDLAVPGYRLLSGRRSREVRRPAPGRSGSGPRR